MGAGLHCQGCRRRRRLRRRLWSCARRRRWHRRCPELPRPRLPRPDLSAGGSPRDRHPRPAPQPDPPPEVGAARSRLDEAPPTARRTSHKGPAAIGQVPANVNVLFSAGARRDTMTLAGARGVIACASCLGSGRPSTSEDLQRGCSDRRSLRQWPYRLAISALPGFPAARGRLSVESLKGLDCGESTLRMMMHGQLASWRSGATGRDPGQGSRYGRPHRRTASRPRGGRKGLSARPLRLGGASGAPWACNLAGALAGEACTGFPVRPHRARRESGRSQSRHLAARSTRRTLSDPEYDRKPTAFKTYLGHAWPELFVATSHDTHRSSLGHQRRMRTA